ncbi:MAG: alpha/beta hydrolase [Bacteroidales bacterium]|nr:alpha/beta hydrolase [Bacteroidales bacterium]
MHKLAIIIVTFFLLQSCTTIDIAEKDAFDVKRTINSDFFEDHPYNLEKTSFTSEGNSLEAWHISRPENNKTVLYLGGNGFLMQTAPHIIPNLLDNDVNLLVFNYRGYGNNAGEPTVEGIKKDGMAAYHFLTKVKKIKPENIVLHGHSLGTMVATYIAVNQPAAGLVMEAPVTDAPDMIDKLVPWFLSVFVSFELDDALKEDSNLERIENVDVPLLFAVGEKDNITPPEMARELYQKAIIEEKQLSVLKNGGHNDLPKNKKYRNLLFEFYQRLD